MIKQSVYFIEGAFTKLIIEKNTRHNILFRQYNGENDIKEGINYLSNDEHLRISFNRLNLPIFFFHEGEGTGFSIISFSKKLSKLY